MAQVSLTITSTSIRPLALRKMQDRSSVRETTAKSRALLTCKAQPNSTGCEIACESSVYLPISHEHVAKAAGVNFSMNNALGKHLSRDASRDLNRGQPGPTLLNRLLLRAKQPPELLGLGVQVSLYRSTSSAVEMTSPLDLRCEEVRLAVIRASRDMDVASPGLD